MPKAGPYYLYMLDFKRDEEQKRGRNLTLAEVSQMASASWNAMSDDEKAYYKDKAKGGEVKIPKPRAQSKSTSTNQLYTTQGVPVALYDEERRNKEQEKENMRKRIASMIQQLPLMTDFLTYPFYLMYGNYFYKNKDDEYCPAEIGLVKFTFRDGILKKHHAFIKPESVELGYAYTAKAHSEDTHQLPPPPNAFGEKNFERILYEIKKFIRVDGVEVFDGGKQIIFTYNDPYSSEGDQVEILNDFLKQFAHPNDHGFVVYPLTRLFYNLREELAERGKCDHIPREDFANIMLSRDPYDATSGISCVYHEEKDATRHCALSRVYRLSFLLADHFCKPLGVRLIAGKHLPANTDLSHSLLSLDNDSSMASTTSIPNSMKRDNDDESEPGESEPGSTSASEQPTVRSNIRASASTLNFDAQSVQTASSSSAPRTKRPSRGSLVRQTLESQSNITSSTFYNRQ